MSTRKYGWRRPTTPSPHPLLRTPIGLMRLPERVDLSQYDSAVKDQGQTGKCTGEAISGLAEHILIRAGHFFSVCATAIYYWEREIEGTVTEDAGAQLADGISVVGAKGCPPESLWPDTDADLYVAPTPAVLAASQPHRLLDGKAVPGDFYDVRATLASGNPVVIGIDVFDQFESDGAAETGDIELPRRLMHPIGGHAILVTGYDDATEMFDFKNSWGVGWGRKGYGRLPYAYVLNRDLCSDLHTGSVIS